MHVLIIAATNNEIQETVNFFEEKKYELGNSKIQVTVTGIGLVSTAYLLAKHICNNTALVIQAGIAGSFQENKNNTVVAVNKDMIGDMGVEENNLFKDIYDLKL